MTLDQRRAQYAWDQVKQAQHQIPEFVGYKNLAKGAPALVMGNGLMAALAYYHSRTGKNRQSAEQLLSAMLGWLAELKLGPGDFQAAMNGFFSAPSSGYMRATEETLAMLKWLRQFADALAKKED